MNYSDYRFTLDIQIHQAQVSVPVTLNDTARRLYIGLTDGRKPYTIPDGCRAVFAAKKPDNTSILNDCIIEKNSTIVYEFSRNTTSAEGVVDCEIRLYDTAGKELTSPQFILVVDKKVVRDEEIPISESESTTLHRIVLSEEARVQAENTRASAENERIQAEKQRVEAENQRAIDFSTAESSRNNTFAAAEVSREAAYQSSENERNTSFQAAEALRDASIQSAVKNANAAAANVNAAITNANTSTKNANTAANFASEQGTRAQEAATDLLSKANEGLFNGKDGNNGATPYIGENGNWWINGVDTGKPSRGDTGKTGEPGTQGKKGADGYTPIKGIDYFTKADIAEIVAAVLAEITTPDEPGGGGDNTEGGYDESTGNLWGYWDISNINSAPEQPPFNNRFYFYGYVDGVYKEHVEARFECTEPGIRQITLCNEEVYRYYYGSVEVNRLTNNTIGFGSEPQPIMTYQGDYMPDYGYTMWFVGFATPTTKPTV